MAFAWACSAIGSDYSNIYGAGKKTIEPIFDECLIAVKGTSYDDFKNKTKNKNKISFTQAFYTCRDIYRDKLQVYGEKISED